MGDPVSISALIIAVLQASATVIRFLSDIKDVRTERERLLNEIVFTQGLLYSLKDKAANQKDTASLKSLASLGIQNGPLDQFKTALERLGKKLRPVHSELGKFGKSLIWPFQKDEVKDILSTIERQKSFFLLALQNSHLYVPLIVSVTEMSRELASTLSDDLKEFNERFKKVEEHQTRVELHNTSNDLKSYTDM